MKISLEKGLGDLESYLVSHGFDIVGVSESADAYIYDSTPLTQISAKNFSPISTLSSDPMLLVCARGKSFSEIEQILTQKTYNKIF